LHETTWKARITKANGLFLAAILAGATCVAIPGCAEDKSMPESPMSQAFHLPFARGVQTSSRMAADSELRSIDRAIDWLNSPPLTASKAARKSSPHRFLDLYLHQLAALASLCSRLDREIPESGIGGARRAHA
jgi:hypothetical protein